ncbi:hypothetical protein HZS_510 [Henneguya salminicola]|nr:hypothetical protein HZS_510 [Henneguya salminicola]
MGLGTIKPDDDGDFILPNIKGKDCYLSNLLGFDDKLGCKKNPTNHLYFIIIYLSPSDIHRFYSPINFHQKTVTQINGFSSRLLSFFSNKFSQKICLNHRIIIKGISEWGNFLMIPIGARNVGIIHLTKREHTSLNSEANYNKGEEMGYFLLGSTIALIFEAPPEFKFSFDSENICNKNVLFTIF